jgi:hypothetical protein
MQRPCMDTGLLGPHTRLLPCTDSPSPSPSPSPGIIAGMLVMGVVGDMVGRKWGSRSTMAVMAGGAVLLTAMAGPAPVFLAVSAAGLLTFGEGVGGVLGPLLGAACALHSTMEEGGGLCSYRGACGCVFAAIESTSARADGELEVGRKHSALLARKRVPLRCT